MRVIIGCEFSQIVTKAFREKGHEAYSCDTIPCEGGHPEWHFQEDILEVLKREKFDLGIFHPPCTHLAVSGAKHFWYKEKEQAQALSFIAKLLNANIKMICLENPVSVISTRIRKPDQIIQPYMFGTMERKSICLWLKNLPLLRETNNVKEEMLKLPYKEYAKVHSMSPGKDRGKKRSIFYESIANAMADQWGNL